MSQLTFDCEEIRRKAVLNCRAQDEVLLTAQDSEKLPQFCEDHRIERKPAGIHARPACRLCMHVGQTSPPDGGIIVVGMENDGTISRIRELELSS